MTFLKAENGDSVNIDRIEGLRPQDEFSVIIYTINREYKVALPAEVVLTMLEEKKEVEANESLQGSDTASELKNLSEKIEAVLAKVGHFAG